MSEDKIVYEEKSNVKSGRHTFSVYSVETYWPGYDSGKMEDMPGKFLQQTISLIKCSKPSNLEALAIERKVILRKAPKREITNEPEGYAKLKHKQLVTHVKEHPGYHLQTLQQAVKNSL